MKRKNLMLTADDTRIHWPTALGILRDAGAAMNRIGPETSLAEALQLITQTAVTLIGADPADGARAVIYTYDAAQTRFNPQSRVSAGEGEHLLVGDAPRADGVGAVALARRRRVLSYEEPAIAFHPLKYQAGIRTAACYPLLVSGEPVGALYIDLCSARHFAESELLVLDTFVTLAAVAIHNTRQFERKVAELERLRQAEQVISSRLNLRDTLQEILKVARELTGAEHGSFRLLDKKANELRFGAIEPDAWAARHQTLAVSETGSVMGWVAHHRASVRINDLRQPPWADIYRPLHPAEEMRSEMAVPLLGPGNGLEGVLNVESPRLSAFTPEAEQTLKALATQAVIAIQEAKLIEAIEAMSAQLVSRLPDEVFELLIDRACDLLNVADGAIWETDWATPQTLTLRASTHDLPPRYQVPVAGSLLGLAVSTERPVVSEALSTDPRLSRRELVQRMGWASALIVPLLSHAGRPYGAFGVYTTTPRKFSDWDQRLLSGLANHAAVALQHAEAVTQIKLAEERQAVAETFAVLGDVAANLLHRINNLISLVPVHVQAIADKRPEVMADAYIQTRLDDIETSARAALKAARETMQHLRPLRLQAVSVALCYQTALERLTVPAHIQLEASGLEALPLVLAGEEQLRLIFFNLIENALDALGEQAGHITVSGQVVDDGLPQPRRWAEIIVADTGPGVPASHREKVFAPNFSTKRSLKKMGFGLWWVKAWVQRLGGSITVASPTLADGQGGCAFTIRLPLI